MSRFTVKGRVTYFNLLPVQGAHVVILDKDIGGDGDDVLWSGDTNAQGAFEGTTTRDWKDRNTATVSVRGPWGTYTRTVDVLDFLCTWFKVTKDGDHWEGPFVRVGDESVPIWTPWVPTVTVTGVVKQALTGHPVEGVSITLYSLTPLRQLLAPVLSDTTDSDGRFSGSLNFGTDLPVVDALTSLVLGYIVTKGSDMLGGIISPYVDSTIYVPWGLNPFLWRIRDHGPDADGGEPRDDVASNSRTNVEIFNFASVGSQTDKRHHYADSGQRFAFRLNNGVLEYRTQSPGTAFTGEWLAFQAAGSGSRQAVSYLRKRAGEPLQTPRFEMIAAGGNRVFAKEEGRDRFFFTIIDPLFWQYKESDDPTDRETDVVPGVYFKLDPEAGVAGANNRDLVRQIEEDPAGCFHGHPATVRFPVYRKLVGSGFTGMMVIKKTPRLWHQLDSRPPAPCRASVPAKFGEPYTHIRYEHSVIHTLKDEGKSIDFDAVLDLGVGSVHLHEQYSEIYGGEMQALFLRPLSVQVYLYLYQFFNGQIQDGDGFVDGTCNYYMLCRLRNPDRKRAQKYVVLFIDEQSRFSNRWRAVDPEDYEPLELGNFLFAAEVQSKLAIYRDLFDYDYDRFWDPLAAQCVNDNSRLAVARQIIAVNGKDGRKDEIYTINYSWGTMDRTWRWRALPQGTKAWIDPEAGLSGGQIDPEDICPSGVTHVSDAPSRPAVRDLRRGKLSRPITPEDLATTDMPPALFLGDRDVVNQVDAKDYVYPQTIKLRDDATLVMKGTKGFGSARNRKYYAGRYFQKYLPANLEMPERGSGAHAKPNDGFAHDWQFVPESVFKRIDSYSHFGVYENVDSRSQYYEVELSKEDSRKLDENAVWEDAHNTLYIRCPRVDWSAVSGLLDGHLENLLPFETYPFPGLETIIPPGPSVAVPALPLADGDVRPLSMFNRATLFRVTQRKGVGDQKDEKVLCIATFWDKRDDDLMLVANMGATVELKDRNRPGIAISAKFTAHRRVPYPPLVRVASLRFKRDPRRRISSAIVSFELPERVFSRDPQSEHPDINRTIWRVVVAALGNTGSAAPIVVFDSQHCGAVRSALGSQRFAYKFVPDQEQRDLLEQYFSSANCWKSGATIWFEDIVGQKNTAETTIFDPL